MNFKKWFRNSNIVAIIMILIGSLGLGYQFTFGEMIDLDDLKITKDLQYSQIKDGLIISTDVRNAEITINGTKNKDITGEISYATTKKDKDEYEITFENNKLTITEIRKTRLIISFPKMSDFIKRKIVLNIPEDLLVTIDAKTSNGKIDFNNLNIEQLYSKTSNGAINLDNLNSKDKITADTSNGRIEIKNINSNGDIIIETSNGRIELNNINTDKDIKSSTSNGRIFATDLKSKGNVSFKSSNGKIELFNLYAPNVDIKTSNGNLTLVNDDMDYVIDNLYVKTSNGKEYIKANYNRR